MSNNERKEGGIVFKGRTEAIYKVIVIGDPAVGKTELFEKFATNQFEEKYLPTVGVRILKVPIELKDFNATVNLMFWDIAGQPQFYMLHRPYFNGADGMLLVFDITRSSTFSNVNNWYSAAVKYGLSEIPRILIGNKAHLKGERKIILPMAEHLAEKLNAHYYETSTLSGENLKEAFEKIAEEIYRAKGSNKPKKNIQLIIKPYQGEVIDIPENPKYTIPEYKRPSPHEPIRIKSKKEKMNKNKKKKREQKVKALIEKEKKKKKKEKYQRDLVEILKGKKQQEPDESFKVPTEIKQLRKTFSKIKKGKGKGKSFIPLSSQLGIPGTSYRIQFGLINGKWASRLLKGKDIIDSYVYKEEDLRKKSNRDGDDDDFFFPYPYIFNPPKPPDDFAMAPQVQVRAPLKEKDPEEEIYCQYCGKKLTTEEHLNHSCNKKP
ncbi:MAG: GTP-binding protein [Candidatus Lokiarchaeota archaeon]|nr:GTP-binding protein [Candidatus Lokiarchaeota archaeon]